MYIDISEFLSARDDLIFKKSDVVKLDDESLDIELTSDPKFNLMITKVDRDLYLDLNIFFNYKTNCDRCLTDVEVDDQVKYKALLVSQLPENESNDEESDLDYVKLEKNKIHISELIRQLILLSIPLKTLCDEDCKGLCQKCGTNLNLDQCSCEEEVGDIRFAVLEDLELD